MRHRNWGHPPGYAEGGSVCKAAGFCSAVVDRSAKRCSAKAPMRTKQSRTYAYPAEMSEAVAPFEITRAKGWVSGWRQTDPPTALAAVGMTAVAYLASRCP